MLPYLALGLKGEMYYCCCWRRGGGVISCFAVGTKEGVEILNDNGSSLIYLLTKLFRIFDGNEYDFVSFVLSRGSDNIKFVSRKHSSVLLAKGIFAWNCNGSPLNFVTGRVSH